MGDRSPLATPRRTEGKRLQGRSAEVVRRVMQATAEEIGRVGVAAFRIEDVAVRSGVNKTTIYRRWPTKSDLIASMLDNAYEAPRDFDQGSLELDLRGILFDLRARLQSARERGVLQVIQAERAHPDVAAGVRALRTRQSEVRRRVFERAIARGELPASADPSALVEFITAPVVARIVHHDLPVDDAYLEYLIQVVSTGAKRERA